MTTTNGKKVRKMGNKTIQEVFRNNLKMDMDDYFDYKKPKKKVIDIFKDAYKLGFREGCYHTNHKHRGKLK